MILPGLISLAFYKRRPTTGQVVLSLLVTVVLSAALGYVSPGGPLGQIGSVIVAVIGGVVLYVAIWLYLIYRYQPQHSQRTMATPPDHTALSMPLAGRLGWLWAELADRRLGESCTCVQDRTRSCRPGRETQSMGRHTGPSSAIGAL